MRRRSAARARPSTSPPEADLFALERARHGLVTELEQVISELAVLRAETSVTPQLAELERRRRSLIAALVRIDERISALTSQPLLVTT
jgi:hypothetical protein